MSKMGEERREVGQGQKVSRNQFWQNFAATARRLESKIRDVGSLNKE